MKVKLNTIRLWPKPKIKMTNLTHSVSLFPLDHYTFGIKEAVQEKSSQLNSPVSYRSIQLQRSVDACLLVHEHGHPHILALQINDKLFRLPGDTLREGEDEFDGLKRILDEQLSPREFNGSIIPPSSQVEESLPSPKNDWDICDLLSVWWRPNADQFTYPYCPPHVTKPVEMKKIFLVQLPEKKSFAVPKNQKLMAVPLFELFENEARYGPVISSIPHVLSRFNFLNMNKSI
jgi:cleavage and polyadenylation specificity factor subunit 5